jgi:hypothetical protein
MLVSFVNRGYDIAILYLKMIPIRVRLRKHHLLIWSTRIYEAPEDTVNGYSVVYLP